MPVESVERLDDPRVSDYRKCDVYSFDNDLKKKGLKPLKVS